MRGLVCIFALLLAAATAHAQQAAQEVRFDDPFDAPGTLEEAPSPEASASPHWWLNSGARWLRPGGTSSTIVGALPKTDPWRQYYKATSPVDTDNGKHPQNLFRLLTRRTWTSFKQTVFFRVLDTNVSKSPNRNASNAVLLFLRYRNGDDFYYAGVRVDGAAVIKRKRGGGYATLAYRPLYTGGYDRDFNPSLLPHGRRIGLKATISDREDGGVKIKLKVADPTLGDGWTPVLEAIDTGIGDAPLHGPGFAGIRTDFMDVELDDYSAVPKSG